MSISDLYSSAVTDIVQSLDTALGRLDTESLERVKAASDDAPPFELREFMARQFAMGRIALPEANALHAIAQRWHLATTAERVVWMQMCAALATS